MIDDGKGSKFVVPSAEGRRMHTADPEGYARLARQYIERLAHSGLEEPEGSDTMDETVRVPRVDISLHEIERAVDDSARAIIDAVEELRAAQDTTNVLLRKILNRLTDPVLRDAE